MSTPPLHTLSLEAALQQAVEHHRAGRFQEAQNYYHAILQADPKQTDANHNLGVLAGQIGQILAGLPHLKMALDVMPNIEQYSLSYAEALLATGQAREAMEVVFNAEKRDLNTPSIQALRQKIQAALVASTQKPELSQAEINQLVALFNAARYAEMENYASALLQRFPEVGFLWKALGASLQSQGKESLTVLQKTVEFLPDDADAHSNLGIALAAVGQLDDAVKCYRQAITINPQLAAAHSNLGIALTNLGQIELAIKSCRRALGIQPDSSEMHSNLGNALAFNNFGNSQQDLSRLDEARTAFENALRLKPDYALVHNNLGLIFLVQGKPELAAQSFKRALTITPDFIDAHNNLGVALEKMDELDEAVVCYLGLLNKGLANVRTYNNLGNVYLAQWKTNEAVNAYQSALLLDSVNAETYCNLGYALIVTGKLSEATEQLARAIQLNPEMVKAYLNLSAALCSLGKYEEAISCLRKAMEMKPDNSDIYSNFLFVSQFLQPLEPANLFAEHLQFAHHFESPVKSAWQKHDNVKDKAKRLKIAYVSADFRAHAVASFIEPILTNHDKKQFEVFCYYNHLQHDAVTDRIQARVEHWLPCLGLSDELLAARIRNDGIDILIDLSGHAGGGRLMTFARKPAPVQITYLGYPGTTGLSSMNYRITDGHADTKENEQFYSEKLLRLPDSLCCYQPARGMPEVSILPALKNAYITFGSFNNSNKIDQRTIHLWAQVMTAVPQSRLVMATIPEGARREVILNQFEIEGVAKEQIDFCGILPAAQFHALFQQVDIALDPLLITGGTTTCESLWMGLPVIILVGQRFLHRVGYSFLCSAGLQQYAANTPEEYIRIAVATTSDIQGLAQLRATMRERLNASPLIDQKKFVLNFEKTLRDTWGEWCSTVSG